MSAKVARWSPLKESLKWRSKKETQAKLQKINCIISSVYLRAEIQAAWEKERGKEREGLGRQQGKLELNECACILKNSKKPQGRKLDILAAIKHCCQGARGGVARCRLSATSNWLNHKSFRCRRKVCKTFACNCQHTFFQLDFYLHASFTHKLMYVCMHTHTHTQTKCTKEVARRESRPLTAKVAPATSFSIVFYALYLTACSVFQFRLDLIRLVVVCLFDCGAIK